MAKRRHEPKCTKNKIVELRLKRDRARIGLREAINKAVILRNYINETEKELFAIRFNGPDKHRGE